MPSRRTDSANPPFVSAAEEVVPIVPSLILFGAMSAGIGSWHVHQILVVGKGAACGSVTDGHNGR